MPELRATRRDPHQLELMRCAERLGVAHRPLPHALPDVVLYSYAGEDVAVRKGRVFPSLTADAERVCDHKPTCKRRLHALGVPTPAGFTFDADESEAEDRLSALLRQHPRLVCKPARGTHGEGVALGLTDTESILRHARGFRPAVRAWVAEAEIPGGDLRIQAIDGVLFAACVRVPAEVCGDGRRSVAQLIAARDAEVRALNPSNRLEVDAEVHRHLAAEGLSLDDIPREGRVLRLRQVANMAQGARAVDVSDELHPDWRPVVERIAAGVGISVFAVDAKVVDVSAPPRSGAVLEVNARPEWLHHTFSDVRRHDVGAALLRASLPLGR